MLQPNRVKFRNMHRGRRKGMAMAGSKINFGEYGLKATESAWVTSRQLEAARRAMTRYARRAGSCGSAYSRTRASPPAPLRPVWAAARERWTTG